MIVLKLLGIAVPDNQSSMKRTPTLGFRSINLNLATVTLVGLLLGSCATSNPEVINVGPANSFDGLWFLVSDLCDDRPFQTGSDKFSNSGVLLINGNKVLHTATNYRFENDKPHYCSSIDESELTAVSNGTYEVKSVRWRLMQPDKQECKYSEPAPNEKPRIWKIISSTKNELIFQSQFSGCSSNNRKITYRRIQD
jgi:hypothetical protein